MFAFERAGDAMVLLNVPPVQPCCIKYEDESHVEHKGSCSKVWCTFISMSLIWWCLEVVC